MTKIQDSIVVKGRGKIISPTINKRETNNDDTADINSSIVVDGDGEITNPTIDFTKEKKKFFWTGFLSGVVASLIASAIWYFIQKAIETN